MNKKAQQGFTLVEIMVVVTLLGILAMLGIPEFRKSTDRAEAIATANDIGKFVQAVELYGTSEGNYPTNMNYITMPDEVRGFMPAKLQNGHYDWRYINLGNFVYVIVRDLELTAEQAISIDKTIDDGNVTRGNLWFFNYGTALVYFFAIHPSLT